MCGGGCRTARRVAFAHDLRESAEKILKMIIERRNDPTRTGGYMTAWQLEIGEVIIAPSLILTIVNGKDEKYRAFCQEKAERLTENHRLFGHLSSFESMEEEKDHWPGAIIVIDHAKRRYLFSFSGLDWKDDEAAMLLVAVDMGMNRAHATKIAHISNNEVYFDLIDKVGGL